MCNAHTMSRLPAVGLQVVASRSPLAPKARRQGLRGFAIRKHLFVILFVSFSFAGRRRGCQLGAASRQDIDAPTPPPPPPPAIPRAGFQEVSALSFAIWS